MKKFNSIEQFRHVCHNVKSKTTFIGLDENNEPMFEEKELPTIKFIGRVKLHGTNAAIVKHKDRSITFQSRNNVISVGKDNMGFALAHHNKDLSSLFEGIEFNDYCALYGEWCGESIQGGVALTQLPRMFVLFACQIDDQYIDFNTYTRNIIEEKIYNINDFLSYQLDIDFNNVEEAEKYLATITDEVEKHCPVAKELGVTSGILTGEGLVWTSVEKYKGNWLQFKTKGDKHKVSEFKNKAELSPDEVATTQEFSTKVVSENRLLQGLEYLKENNLPVNDSSIGYFIAWMTKDVFKEESDLIAKFQINPKTLRGFIAKTSREWLLTKFDEKS